MKILYVILGVILPISLGGWLLSGVLGDGTEDTPEWNISNLRIWKNTPAWELALAVKHQNTVQIASIAKAHLDLLNYREPRFGATLLIWAVGVEKYQSVEELLKCGANPNIATTYGRETALFTAAHYSWVDNQAKEDPKYVRLLLKYGADPNINYAGGDKQDNITVPGASPLMESIGCGIEKTRALVEKGADINHNTPTGETPVLYALREGTYSDDNSIEYAYYLIAVKRAKVTESYIVTSVDDSKHMTEQPMVNILREWFPDIKSKGYQMKMEIVAEFKRQGIDYWKTIIPDNVLQQIKHIYPDTWQEYVKKY